MYNTFLHSIQRPKHKQKRTVKASQARKTFSTRSCAFEIAKLRINIKSYTVSCFSWAEVSFCMLSCLVLPHYVAVGSEMFFRLLEFTVLHGLFGCMQIKEICESIWHSIVSMIMSDGSFSHEPVILLRYLRYVAFFPHQRFVLLRWFGSFRIVASLVLLPNWVG